MAFSNMDPAMLLYPHAVGYVSKLEPSNFVQAHPHQIATEMVMNAEFCQLACLDPSSDNSALVSIVEQLQQAVSARLAHQLHQAQLVHTAQQSTGFITPVKAPTAGASPFGRLQAEVQSGVDAGGDTVVLPGAPADTGKKTRTNWSVYEGDMLNAQMKIHEDMLLDPSTGIKYRTMSGSEKFTMISERLSQLNPPVHRTISQIEDKWDRMTSDFKKVYDWDKQSPSGKPSY
jgi:hypothetical protein